MKFSSIRYATCRFILGLLCAHPLALQSQAATGNAAISQSTPQQVDEFDFASIRPSDPKAMSEVHWTAPTGYSSKNKSLLSVIITAYLPPGDWSSLSGPKKIVDSPDWVKNDLYDIVAGVAPEQIPAWQSQGTERRLLQAMLRHLLSERFGLVVEKTTVQVPVYGLFARKEGTKLGPDKIQPLPERAIQLTEGGYMLTPAGGGSITEFRGVSMKSLAALLTLFSNRPVIDMTGQPGTYSFALEKDLGANDVANSDPETATIYNLKKIGLQMKTITMPLVGYRIVRINRPTAN